MRSGQSFGTDSENELGAGQILMHAFLFQSFEIYHPSFIIEDLKVKNCKKTKYISTAPDA